MSSSENIAEVPASIKRLESELEDYHKALIAYQETFTKTNDANERIMYANLISSTQQTIRSKERRLLLQQQQHDAPGGTRGRDDMLIARIMCMTLTAHLAPVSPANSKRSKLAKRYRADAIKFYYGNEAEGGKMTCMVTGEQCNSSEITAGHIYMQSWPDSFLVEMGMTMHDPRNIILMRNQVEERFDRFEWTIIPQSSTNFLIYVLNPDLLKEGTQQWISGHDKTNLGQKWSDVHDTQLHLPPGGKAPARRLCGLHAALAINRAKGNGWFTARRQAPEVLEAAWDSPGCDKSDLMSRFLADI